MKVRFKILVPCLLVLAAAWFLWPRTGRPVAGQTPATPAVAATSHPVPAVTATNAPVAKDSIARSAASTNRLTFRLANTPKSITQLSGDRHAILLENAFIDTAAAIDLKIPTHLRAGKEPGAFIVQSHGVIDGAFRDAIAGAGGTVVSYIPNNAFLVQVSSAGAAVLADNASVQAVLPYEPYYKVQASLLDLAINQKSLPAGTYLTLGLYNASADATMAELKKLGAEILGRDRSPFGPIVRVRAPADWIALAQLPGVGNVEPVYPRRLANDLSRVALGVSTNTTDLATNNYLGLTGKNITVEMNDTGVDPTHPDFSLTGTAAAPGTTPPSRVFGDFTNSLYDTDGHGTHVAGIIAGNGSKSYTITNVSGSVTNADFRGKAPLASIVSIGAIEGGHDFNIGDQYLQEQPALSNALISNNSWTYGDSGYDLAAASYDAAVRDAIPEATGPQPVLFVFAAGNDGSGSDNGTGGFEDSIGSPGTAKNVITVGALEELRNITNIVTALDGTSNAIWAAQTDSGFQVAGYSSRGNVGVETEGAFGRFKPDVVAPGTFAVSLRSQVWDEEAYYNPTNYHVNEVSYFVTTNTLAYGFVTVPENAVGVSIQVVPNTQSPTPFPINFPIYISRDNVPDPTDPTTYDIYNNSNSAFVSIPPSTGGVIGSIVDLENSGFIYAVGDATNQSMNFDVIETIITTNDLGNQLLVLSNLNNSLGGSPDSKVPPHYYRYESGTSMATPAVSGVLALMQDFFVNKLNPNFATNPSPALLKAMVINGARLTGNYQFAVTNTLNYEGWGQVNLPNSVPAALTNTVPGVSNGVPMFFVDQSPTNALATGDRRTYNITFANDAARFQPLRVTLAWTDPPGNPAAAFKLVNDLDLVVTNNDNPTNPVIYFGNSFDSSGAVPYSAAGNSNSVADNINNVENVFLPPMLGTNYSVTVIAHAVNVNAVTLEQTRIVQDFALVISSGDGNNTNGIVVTPVPPTPGSTPDVPRVDYLPATNSIYFNQYAGAYSPGLSTNNITFGTNSPFAPDSVFHIGQTNQWHFYVVTNTTGFTNAAFIIFLPNTAAIPVEGVFADTDANSTRPEADLELFVASPTAEPLAPQLTNLNFIVLSNCIYNVNDDQAAIGRGGSEFIAYSNSQPNQIYYIGVQCEDQMAGQYAFVPIFSQEPFSTTDQNGNTYVHGVNVPVNIPDGNNAHPGVGYVIGLSLQSQTVGEVIVTNTYTHQNFGDLVGSLSHVGNFTTLNNHDGLGVVTPAQQFIYDDTGAGDVPGAMHTDGPGNLQNFRSQPGIGLWLLTEVDDSFSQTGAVTSFQMKIKPHKDLQNFPFVVVSVPAGGWFYDYVDVPVGYTNLLVVATNLPPTAQPPIQLFVKEGGLPTLTDTNDEVTLTNCLVGTYPTGLDPGNSMSLGPPLVPDRYFVGLYNPSGVAVNVLIGAILSFNSSAVNNLNFRSTDTPLPLLDDALTLDPLTGQNSTISVPNFDIIQSFSVGLRVDHPRISDMVFTLISPDGSRYLLMENRGGQSTNGCGTTSVTTNNFTATANGNGLPNTNFFNLGSISGTIPITYDFFTAPDEMTIYYGTNITSDSLIYDTGSTNGQLTFMLNYGPTNGIVSTYVTVVMNQLATTTNGADQWNYTVGGVQTNYAYLSFTEDTNLTTTPIKFALPPFTPVTVTNIVIVTNITLVPDTTNISSFDFESVAANDYASNSVVDGWNVIRNQASVVSDPPNAQAGSQFLTLANSSISRTLATVPGSTNTLTFGYRGPGVVSWWRYEGSLVDNVGGYKAQFVNGGGYATCEVGNGITLDGVVDYLLVQPPVSSKLDVGLGSGLTMELWINPARVDLQSLMFRYENILGSGNGSDEGMEFNIHPGGFLRANIVDSAANGHVIISAANTVVAGVWQHVALTYNRSSGNAVLYLNGALVAQANLGVFTPQTSFTNLLMGTGTYLASSNRPAAINMFAGDMDETSIYKRALSASEIKAIWQAGSVGKVDRGYPIPSDFSEARLTLDSVRTIAGVGTNTLLGNNTTWQTNSITFIATTNSTTLQLDGIEPGMLLDSFALTSSQFQTNYVTNIVVTTSNLYYQAEQSLSPIIGTSARGNWQLEALDNRAGATNPQPELVSWQLSFTFANTNFTIPIGNLYDGIIQTNFAPAGSFAWFAISVPTNAIAQTNTLLFANLPLNIWFSTSTPPTTNSPFGTEEQTNSLGGIVVLYPNSTPLPMVPGTTNYLGVQNLNQFGATYAISVNFELTNVPVIPYGSNNVLPFANSLPATSVTGTNAQLNGFATPNLTNGSTATAWFQWGPTTTYGNVTTPQNVGFGFSVVYQDAYIDGLIFGQVYHCRLVVSNSMGVAYGADEQFAPGYVVSWGDNTFGQTNVPPGLVNVVALAGGLGHSLGLLDDGTMTGWGDNTFGQITSPLNLGPVAAIAAGDNHNLALLANGTITAWGDDRSGQTNIPAGLDLTSVVAIAAGASNSVALLFDGTVVAWGDNTFGQTNVPPGLSNVVAIASGGNDVVALLNNGTVVGWGDNTFGQTNAPSSVSNIVAVASGTYHNLALYYTNGLITAWGDNTAGETNIAPAVTNVVAIAAGFDDNLVLQGGGTALAWGTNSFGQTNVPAGLSEVFAVACGVRHDLVLTAEPPLLPPYAHTSPATSVTGTNAQINGFATPNTTNGSLVTAWFQWGTSTNYAFQSAPVSIGNGYGVVYVTNQIADLIYGQAYHFQLVVSNYLGTTYGFDQLLVAGSSVAWGNNAFGQTTVPPGLSNVVSVAAGGQHSLEILTNGAVLTWGDNVNGQTQVPAGMSNTVAIAGGFSHSLGLQSNGVVTAWGDNTFGQSTVPASVSNMVAVAGGGFASLALQNSGLVAAWGDNTFGQINVPAGVSNVVEVAEGAEHSLALLNDGTVIGWGTNQYQQISVPSLHRVVAVAAGGYHSLALLDSGAVLAWGLDNLGQATVPAVCSSNVVAIAAGGYHSMALLNDGSVVVWGDNSLGQANVPASASNVVAVAAGTYHNVVLTSPYPINLNLFPNPGTNVVAPGQINWFQINVPTNAIAATNTLLFATLPVNMWWSTNFPPSITTPNDVELLSTQSAGSVVLYHNTPRPTIVAGGTYYLGIQNPNTLPVTNAVQVTFEYAVPPVLPPVQFEFVQGGDTLVVTNTAFDIYPLDVLDYTLSTNVLFAFPIPPNNTNTAVTPVISPNGIITWAVPTNTAVTFSLFNTTVTDTNTGLGDANSFVVIAFPRFDIGVPVTNGVASNSISWTLIHVPTNAIAATNTLVTASAPVNLWYSTNLPPSITNSSDIELLTNSVNGTNVISITNTVPVLLPGGFYFLGVENPNSFAITNVLEVTFRYRLLPPMLPVIPDQVVPGGMTLTVTNTATDTNVGVVLVYTLVNPPPGASIDANGIITYVTTTNIAPTNVVITTIVTDTTAQLSATNSFNVFVLPALIDGQPQTNVVAPGGINWFQVNVPPNALAATNTLLFATLPVNFWFSTNVPPTITNSYDFELLTNSLAGNRVLDFTTVPPLVPGSTYYLGVQNPNLMPVTNAVEVTFLLSNETNFSIFSIVQTNMGTTNGFLLTWFAPSGTQFHLQWTPELVPMNWTNFKGVISFTSFIAATNSEFQYFDDGSQTGGFGPDRFYRLQLLNSPTNTEPEFLLKTTNYFAAPQAVFTVTNNAHDWDIPGQTLVYSVTNSLSGTNYAVIGTNTGIIAWTPDVTQTGLTNYITTIVRDNGVPAKSATNILVVVVGGSAVPSFTSAVITAGGVKLQWLGMTNEEFNVQWATNLVAPIAWTVFPDLITSTNGTFNFTDTNSQVLMKFYQLILLP